MWHGRSFPLLFHRREQLSHSTQNGRTGEKAKTTTDCSIVLSITKWGHIHWNFNTILLCVIFISYQSPKPEKFYYSSSEDKKQSQRQPFAVLHQFKLLAIKSLVLLSSRTFLPCRTAVQPTQQQSPWHDSKCDDAQVQTGGSQEKHCCETIGNPTRLPVLSKVAVVLLFANLSALLTERFAVPTSILQVHLNKTLVGSRFQLLFQSAAPVTSAIHVPIAVLGLLLFSQ